MSILSKAAVVGLLTIILGLILSPLPVGLELEETIGLDLLFRLRGKREVPSEVIIVTIDRVSSDKLNLPAEPEKWPRSLHARLIDNLAKGGVAVIALDIIFEEPQSAEDDNLLAQAISHAGNVVLGEYIKKDILPVSDDGGTHTADVNIETLVPPFAPFARSAVALAPFPLPKVPIKVSQYWTFKTSAGDTPTLPIVAYQVFALQLYDEFLRLSDRASSALTARLPRDKEAFIKKKSAEKLVRDLREIFKNNPAIAENMLQELSNLPIEARKKRILKSLVTMYQSLDSRYLNFYGPPGTIPTIPYYQLLQPRHMFSAKKKRFDFEGKAVFVGLSERLRPEQKDGFYTTFSQSSGVDISGVEIAATAFANLLEDMPIQPLYLLAHTAMLFLWGALLGIVCCFLPAVYAAVCTIGMGILYLFLARHQFSHAGIWYPLVVPLFFQAPLAFFAAVFWKYFEAQKERQNIKKAFGYYLPEKVVDQLAKDVVHIQSGTKIVYGTCLCTDAEQYTTLSETMDPKELRSFLNNYYQAVFEPVKNHGGIVSDVIGDSMMALWTTTHPDVKLRKQACLAALEISRAVDKFNQASDVFRLPTRIGLHSGNLALGSVGAINHFEYRAVGDIVNTVSRIESLNKRLGTSILVSAEVLYQVDDFLTRELGKFLLSGKSKPVVLYELICPKEESSEQQKTLCAMFSDALSAYRGQSWEKAIDKLKASMQMSQQDGPSLLYLRLCERYRENPPGESWDGLVRFYKK